MKPSSPIRKGLYGLLLLPLLAQADPLLQPNDLIAAGGDSITEIRRYTVYMEDYLLMCQPVEPIRLVQFGWGGTTADHFLRRVDSDILPWHPSVATICFGMNDGRYPDGVFKALLPAGADAYRKNLTEIVGKLKAGGVRTIVVGSPGVVDSYYAKLHIFSATPTIPADLLYNKTLADLAEIARDVAEKQQVVFADVHGPMADVMPKAKSAFGEQYVFAGVDGIHPKAAGSLVMAYSFLKALGCDGAIGTITVDLASNQAQGTPGQKVLSSHNGRIEIESTRYPFCFTGDPAKGDDVEATSNIVRFFPFNADLNRYLLVVKGLSAPKAKVTWGAASKEFAAADLAKGINLVEEFIPNNPFSEQFSKVNRAVQLQQEDDMNLTKSFLPNLSAFKLMLPTDKAPLIDDAATAGRDHEADLYHAAAALVVPLRHTIQIDPLP